ncbi:hypothetical protein Cob_v001679 [Colletotrichum orbiculare MAFF 240422]|uniref:Uncharacterized protein n=1 Tax=Colletotrichum orbiculare (strain 104-T / ATCC 96160 / CBS 514.97 / LARS 414 / MAFF 240422) TaxID=1213857 RepID=A0A484G4A0_COLOR|nr:hypothetical protein Cob_v001679 [Colletotrichum orbiculare MAFF 240422]
MRDAQYVTIVRTFGLQLLPTSNCPSCAWWSSARHQPFQSIITRDPRTSLNRWVVPIYTVSASRTDESDPYLTCRSTAFLDRRGT